MSKNSFLLFALCVVSCLTSFSFAADGAGSSAAAPLYRKWAEAYASSASINYEASGSSAGLKKIKAAQVDFGASDVALSPSELAKFGLIQFPSAISGVVPVYNLPGIKSGELKLTGTLLAGIFSGQISAWNDRAIAAVNPAVRLPDRPIVGIVRQDGSGTTYHFSDYLSKISPAWAAAFGRDFSIRWPKQFVQAKGSALVAATLKKTPYAIGYIDYNYVVQDKLDSVLLQNSAGKFIAPSAAAFSAALNGSRWKARGNFEETLTNQSAPKAWPVTMGSFVLMPQASRQPENAIAVLKFFTWGFMYGDRLVDHVDLVRLPDAIQARAFKEMMRVGDASGKPLKWMVQ